MLVVDLRRMCTPVRSARFRGTSSPCMSRSARPWCRRRCPAPRSAGCPGHHQWLKTAPIPRGRPLPPGRTLWADRVPDRHPPRRQADDVAGRDGRGAAPAVGRDPCLDLALRRLQLAHGHLEGRTVPTTAMHGDFWFGNARCRRRGHRCRRLGERRVTGCPLRDLARFPRLQPHTSTGIPGPGTGCSGHGGLRRAGFGSGVRYGLLGSGWLPRLVRGSSRGWRAVGLRGHFNDVALIGLAIRSL